MLSSSLHAIHIVWIAALDFYLNRCMSDGKVMFQLLSHCPEHIFAAANALFIHHDVAATTNHTRPNGPDVQVMHRQHAVYSANRLLDCSHLHSFWNGLQEHIDGFFENTPRTPHNQN